ncbi:hypothetical protein SLA2020_160980 [Shorea laevis]
MMDQVPATANASTSKLSAAEAGLSSKSPVWLLLPPSDYETVVYTSYYDRIRRGSFRYMNLEDNIVYDLPQATSDLFCDLPCIGSSQGWLINLDPITFTPFLFNPFTNVQIQLPSLMSILGISTIEKTVRPPGRYRIQIRDRQKQVKHDMICPCFVEKAILSREPEGGDHYMVFMVLDHKCGFYSIGFYNDGDTSWKEVPGSQITDDENYEDIICNGNQLHALQGNGFVVTWDLRGDCPEKTTTIDAALPEKSKQYLGSGKCYLVEFGGEMLLIVSFTFMFDKSETGLFDLYKLDLEKKEWVELETLGDRSLFLGGNPSVSIQAKDCKGCKENFIYHTSDYWRNEEKKLSENTDDNVSIYSVEDQKIRFSFDCSRKRGLLPCWLIL